MDPLIQQLIDIATLPPEVRDAVTRLERKRVSRENFDALVDFADDARKRRLETFIDKSPASPATQRDEP
jgi:hypothetical protein